ncbi:hypothetical protein [Kitasatospora sp. NPDC059327]|uniref:hypothetical protein n=1 Tax=Kitasatospora sp. NPDC059327 TaxID=3346803 RepID=UPI0036C55EA2
MEQLVEVYAGLPTANGPAAAQLWPGLTPAHLAHTHPGTYRAPGALPLDPADTALGAQERNVLHGPRRRPLH